MDGDMLDMAATVVYTSTYLVWSEETRLWYVSADAIDRQCLSLRMSILRETLAEEGSVLGWAPIVMMRWPFLTSQL